MTDRAREAGDVLVLCPMKVERVAVERAVRRGGVSGVRVVQTGVGGAAVVGALEREAARARPGLVLLAGVCGGLTACADVPPVVRVVDEQGRSWTPAGAESGGVTLIGVDRIISTPEQKRDLAARTGASIVDMEAHRFAEACGRLGLPWAVVRGVSDTPDETLPGEVLGWITPGGDARVGSAVLDMMRKPALIPHVVGFVRRTGSVLREVGLRVVRLAGEGESAAGARATAGPSLMLGVL